MQFSSHPAFVVGADDRPWRLLGMRGFEHQIPSAGILHVELHEHLAALAVGGVGRATTRNTRGVTFSCHGLDRSALACRVAALQDDDTELLLLPPILQNPTWSLRTSFS